MEAIAGINEAPTALLAGFIESVVPRPICLLLAMRWPAQSRRSTRPRSGVATEMARSGQSSWQHQQRMQCS